MSLAGPFTYQDADGAALPGVYYITDVASYERSAEALAAYRVEPPVVQHVLAGVETITLRFNTTTAAEGIVEAVNALTPLPTMPPQPDAPPAQPVRSIARIDFLRRFTMNEMGDIQESPDKLVKAFLYMLTVIAMVDLDAEETQQGVGYMAVLGLIAPERVAAILA
jgi:hypothetical protein